MRIELAEWADMDKVRAGTHSGGMYKEYVIVKWKGYKRTTKEPYKSMRKQLPEMIATFEQKQSEAGQTWSDADWLRMAERMQAAGSISFD